MYRELTWDVPGCTWIYLDLPGMHRDIPIYYPGYPGDLPGLHWDALGCTGMHWDLPGMHWDALGFTWDALGYPGGFRGGRYALAKYAGLNAPMVTSRETPATSRLPPGYLPATSREPPGLSRGRPPRHRILSPARIPYGHPDSPGLSRGTARTLPGHPTYSTGAGTRPNGQRYGSSGNCGERQDAAGLPGPPPSSPRREGESGENGLESALLPSDGCQSPPASASSAQGRPPYMGRRERESGEICA